MSLPDYHEVQQRQEEINRALELHRRFLAAEARTPIVNVTGELDTSIVSALPWHDHLDLMRGVEGDLRAGLIASAVKKFNGTSAKAFYADIETKVGSQSVPLKTVCDGVPSEVYQLALRVTGEVFGEIGLNPNELRPPLTLVFSNKAVRPGTGGNFGSGRATIRVSDESGKPNAPETTRLTVIHELLDHAFDLDVNRELFKHLTPEQIVELYALRAEAITKLNPQYPSEIQNLILPVEDLSSIFESTPRNIYPIRKFTTLGKYPEITASDHSFFLNQRRLALLLPDTRTLKVGAGQSIAEIIKNNQAWIKRINSPFWKNVLKEIDLYSSLPKQLMDDPMIHTILGNTDKLDAAGFVKSLTVFANLHAANILFTRGIEGFRKVTAEFSVSDLKFASAQILNLLMICHSELLAEAMAFNFSRNPVINKDSLEPVERYYKKVAEFLTT